MSALQGAGMTLGIAFLLFLLYAIFIAPVLGSIAQSDMIDNLHIETKLLKERSGRSSQSDRWQPHELATNFDKVLVTYGNVQETFAISNLAVSNTVMFDKELFHKQFQGYHPMALHLSNNRLYIDLAIATAAKPIQIKMGKIIDLPEGWRWNANSNALEIVNERVEPVFQETYIYPNQFTIKGALRAGDKVFVVNELYPSAEYVSLLDSRFFPENYQGKMPDQIFAYPRSEYPGVLFKK